jgi:uncharacterized membrane protein YfcA
MEPSFWVAGAVTGVVVGLTGVGGGALMTPLLLLFFDVAPLAAIGTDLWFAALTKLAATRLHHAHGLIDWPVVKRLWIGSLSASALTLLWMQQHPLDPRTVGLLLNAIAMAVLITALGLLLQPRLHALGLALRVAQPTRFKAAQTPLTVLAGTALGVLVTLTSVGAGALGAVFLVYLYPLRLTPPRLVATDIVHAIPLALFAGMGHLLMGHVDFVLLGNLLLGSLPAVLLGAMLSARLPHGLIKTLLALVLLAVSAKILLSNAS